MQLLVNHIPSKFYSQEKPQPSDTRDGSLNRRTADKDTAWQVITGFYSSAVNFGLQLYSCSL